MAVNEWMSSLEKASPAIVLGTAVIILLAIRAIWLKWRRRR